MSLPSLAIVRPVATSLITLGIALAGALAYFQLPVAALPQVDFPFISVQASFPGASPETMAATVATPLERALGHIAGINEMTSSSNLGSTNIRLQFDLGRDFDAAGRDVQAAINAASSLLPANMPSRPSYRRNNPNDTPLMLLALTSDILSREQMFDIASTYVAQKASQVEGVGQVDVRGSSLPAVRVELNPAALAKYGISFEQVRNAITNTNVNRPKGQLENSRQSWQIAVNDQAAKAADYLPLIVAYSNGAPVRLSDLGRVVDASEALGSSGYLNDKPAIMLAIRKQDNANVIATVDKIRALLPQLQASIPKAAELSVVMDRSGFIKASLFEVKRSLVIAVMLVIVVISLFLRNLHSSMIPVVTVPVTLLGTLGVMYLFGFSLDILSLMALTVATGFVVDDTIVVIENTIRYMEQGMPAKRATLKSIREVSFTLLSMSLSLIAVFLPILLMGGIVGRLFREFGMTLSIAVLVSLILSYTTTPMLCALWLKVKQSAGSSDKTNRQNWLDKLLQLYDEALAWILKRRHWVLIALLTVVSLNIYLYIIVPKGFFPVQDTGRLIGGVWADQTVSSSVMQDKMVELLSIVRREPGVANVIGNTGGSRSDTNSGQIFVMLKPLEERDVSADQIMAKLRKALSGIAGINLYLRPAQELRIGGRPSPATYEYAIQADELDALREWTPRIYNALQQLPELADVNSDQQNKGQQVSLEVNRADAARLGVNQVLINSTLNDAFGQRQVSVIYEPLNQYHVVMEAAPEYAQNSDALDNLYVSTAGGTGQLASQVPLSAFSEFKFTNTALSVNHQGQFPTATISFNLAEGVSLSAARQAVNHAMDKLAVPGTVHGSFQGTAKEFEKSLNNQPWLILSTLIAIYIVLGMLYESYIHPITILSTLPSAGVGAILALMLFDTEFSIMALIGLILLIGIVKKNAIMMIDFAINAERRSGLTAEQAIRKACHLRFRPILMTTCGALLAAVPLAFGSGYGYELLRPLGITIIGGLVFSQLLTLFTTPVIYIYLDRLERWVKAKLSRPRAKSISVMD